MSKNQDVIACFKQAFATNQDGNQPVLNATLSNMPDPQVDLILNMTRDCLARKGWKYTVPGAVDTSQTIQALITSIMNATTPAPAMAGFALPRRKRKTKARVPKKTGKKRSAKKVAKARKRKRASE